MLNIVKKQDGDIWETVYRRQIDSYRDKRSLLLSDQ